MSGGEGRRQYDLAAILAWRDENIDPLPRNPATFESGDGDDLSRREREARVAERLEKVRVAELRRRQIEGELVPKAWMVEKLQAFAGELVTTGEALRQHGDEAVESINDAVDRFLARVRDELDEPPTAGRRTG